jgi:hypothetical protein
MCFNVLAMGILALAMILVTKRLRGRLNYSDAFFPLLLLHWGHAANFLWSWQVTQILATVLAGILLLLVVPSDPLLGVGKAVSAGVCLLLLPLCGINGVLLVPAMALWLGHVGALYWRSGQAHGRRNGLLTSGLALSALSLAALYFVGYENVPYHPQGPSLRGLLATVVQALSVTLGPTTAAEPYWKISGLAVLCLLLISATIVAFIGYSQVSERPRALGLFLFLGAMGALILGIAWGRPYRALDGRYASFVVPALCCAYFVWCLYGPPAVRAVVQMSLFVVTAIVVWPNTQSGVEYAKKLRDQLASMERDMASGVPSYLLINRYASYLHANHDIPTDYFPLLRRARVGDFSLLRDNPPFREVALPLVPVAMNQVTWHGGIAHATGNYPYLVFALPENTYVCGIRVKYSYSSTEGSLPYVSLYWKRDDQNDFTRDQSYKYSPTGDRANWARGTWTRLAQPQTTMFVWLCDNVKELRFHPDFKPCDCEISEILLLVPATSG